MTNEFRQDVAEDAPDELYSFDEAVKFLDTSKSTLYRLLSQEDVKGVKVGKQWRFRKADLTTYLERSPVEVAFDSAARADLAAELEFFAAALRDSGRSPVQFAGYIQGSSSEPRIANLVNSVILLAIGSASDIHIEPSESSLRLRYRIDGVLHDIRRMPMSLHESLIARLKEMAEMNQTEKRLPQDGRVAMRIEEKDFELRLSILPTLYGENMVIRILDRSSLLQNLDELGMSDAELQSLRALIHSPSGLVVATGPTGSGKTTLLYSFLLELNKADRKIVTIEDPVEFRIPDITQSQVSRRVGLTFANAMRTFLRQDPDIILCSEIRDLETAELLVEAALTGHLVFTGLHTENAPAAILRLADIGIQRYVAMAALSGIVAMRLARRLCANCKKTAPLEEILARVNRLRHVAETGGYRIPKEVDIYMAVGCDRCRGTGYRGRIALFEILSCTPNLVGQMFQCSSDEEIRRLAVGSGMRTLLADGMRKAVAGETSIDEVLRATGTWL